MLLNYKLEKEVNDRADSEKSIKEEKIRIRPQCQLRTRRQGEGRGGGGGDDDDDVVLLANMTS